ncbi:LOW QUALITY PROTEIN: WD repeat-containing protein 25-like [Stylophora pistillata]|uniref:LOW QUALITY PROTEIN: WD repeat-containing protein 25-like n=1 Tax=Stylophora pistillata TaxID=50429 RepID=UPI000C055171|nr:LOW QUALITY PROTEIN: WD repeat-containing protein 25-like [Stylophora pistillata]
MESLYCGPQVLSCGYDKTARLFDVETVSGMVVQHLELGVCYLGEGNLSCILSQDRKSVFPHKNYVTCVQFHPSHPALFLAGTFKSSILCWDRRTGSVASTYSTLFGQVQDMAFLPGAEEFISAAEVVRRNLTDKGIMVWDFRSTAVLSNQIYQEAFTCTCLKGLPHESHFMAQSINGDYIALFSTRKPYKLNKFKIYEGHKPMQQTKQSVAIISFGCDFSPDGKIICSGSADGKMFFYDHSTARVMRTIEAHSAPCVDVAYDPTLPSWVATCGWDVQVKVWT